MSVASMQPDVQHQRPRVRPGRTDGATRACLEPARSTCGQDNGQLGSVSDGSKARAPAPGSAVAWGRLLRATLVEHIGCWREGAFRVSVLQSILVLIASLVVNYVAGTYASLHAGHPVRDVLLDRMPTLPVDVIFVDGAFLLWAFVLTILLSAPRTIPFVLKALTLFIVIRSFFVVLTHIGPPVDEAVLDPNRIMDTFTFAGDLFFSGHTGFPFLLSLIFWENKTLRYILLGSSIVFALAVLFGHLHYSIDVFAAFFITDSIFRIAQRMFPREYEMLSRRIRFGRTHIRRRLVGPWARAR
jgi:hypothetical protein